MYLYIYATMTRYKIPVSLVCDTTKKRVDPTKRFRTEYTKRQRDGSAVDYGLSSLCIRRHMRPTDKEYSIQEV